MPASVQPPIPGDYWDRPVIGGMFDRLDLGALMYAITQDFGLTQRALGEMAGFSQTQVSQYIKGAHKPTLEIWTRFVTRMGVPPSACRRLGLSAPDGASGHPLSEVKLHKILRLAEYIGRTGNTSDLATWRALTGPSSLTEPWEHLARIIGEEPHGPVLDQMAARTRGFYLVAAKLPAQLVIRALTAEVRDIELLLGAWQEDGERRRALTAIGGETSYLAACCDVDLGQVPGALDLLDTTAAAAKKAGDPALAAMALDGQSHFEAFRGRPRRALELVEQARSACPAEASTGTAAYLWLRTAEAHAALGEISQAARAWDRAEELYAGTNLAADRNWLQLWLGRDCFESVRAVIFAAIRRPKEAAVWADRVATRLAGQDGKTDAVALLNAALAQVRIGLGVPAAVTGTYALHAMRAAEASGCLPRARELAALIAQCPSRSPKTGAFLRDLEQTEQRLSESVRP
jgi:transcriptional regulator with XRE-family HTH domain